jgi:membrane protein
MPDATLSTQKALFGGLVTVILFTAGRAVLFLYFEFAEPAGQLGSAAGSIAIILLWIYYSSVILLFGAEITFATAKIEGEKMVPIEGAVSVKEQVVR